MSNMKAALACLMVVMATTMANQTKPTTTSTSTTTKTTTSTSTTTKTTTTKRPTTTTTTTRPQSFFPRGSARNGICNIPPHSDEVLLLESHKEEVESTLKEWRAEAEKIPPRFDWRRLGVLTMVADMKDCAAAYAFAAVAMLEAQFKIQHGELKQFSAQQLVDCATHHHDTRAGCSGGRAKTSLEYIQSASGLLAHRDYPWEGKEGKCRFRLEKAELQVSNFLAFSGEEKIRHFVWKRGPVMAYINPALLVNDYPGGVIRNDAAACNSDVSQLTHIVVIVGFGESAAGVKYWIVRNSWGPRWGYRGYFRIERGSNACGVEALSFAATIE